MYSEEQKNLSREIGYYCKLKRGCKKNIAVEMERQEELRQVLDLKLKMKKKNRLVAVFHIFMMIVIAFGIATIQTWHGVFMFIEMAIADGIIFGCFFDFGEDLRECFGNSELCDLSIEQLLEEIQKSQDKVIALENKKKSVEETLVDCKNRWKQLQEDCIEEVTVEEELVNSVMCSVQSRMANQRQIIVDAMVDSYSDEDSCEDNLEQQTVKKKCLGVIR